MKSEPLFLPSPPPPLFPHSPHPPPALQIWQKKAQALVGEACGNC